MPGRRLLGLVDRMRRTARAMAQGVNRIARARLTGVDLAQLAPVGFNPTATHYLVLEAVSWTLALRQRLLAMVRPASYAPALLTVERAPQGRSDPGIHLPAGMVPAEEGDDHDWLELARPWRMGPGGVAVAAQRIEKLSDREVVSNICDKLTRAAAELGSEADVARIAAMEAAARELCPEPAAEPKAAAPEIGKADTSDADTADADVGESDAAKAGAGKADAGKSGGAQAARAAEPFADEPEDEAEEGAEHDPPPKPPPD